MYQLFSLGSDRINMLQFAVIVCNETHQVLITCLRTIHSTVVQLHRRLPVRIETQVSSEIDLHMLYLCSDYEPH